MQTTNKKDKIKLQRVIFAYIHLHIRVPFRTIIYIVIVTKPSIFATAYITHI